MRQIRLIMNKTDMETTAPDDLRKFVNAMFKNGNEIAIVEEPEDPSIYYLIRFTKPRNQLPRAAYIGEIRIRELVE